MKVKSSDLFFRSSSTTQRTFQDSQYDFNQEDKLTQKRSAYRLEQRTRTETALYRTGPDQVARTRHVRESGQVEQGEVPLNGSDDLAKRVYLKSVFDWAADAIEDLVAAFEQGRFKASLQGKDHTGFSNADFQGASGSNPQQVSFYRAMADEFRAKARALVPEIPRGRTASRIRQTLETEHQTTLVQAGGKIQTLDGRKIDFSLDLGLYREKQSERVTVFKVVDPLVINFKGTHARLKDETMAFDLNGDGTEEQIARLGEGSAFLALDKNGDGKVNNGTELFGPLSGNGFRDLAFFDRDKNQWIDENDPVFEQLALWNGDNAMTKLADAGIGAIHLGSVGSEFLVENSSGKAAAMLSGTGIAVTETGEVKTVQQVDMIV